jgi:hypothetical protein
MSTTRVCEASKEVCMYEPGVVCTNQRIPAAEEEGDPYILGQESCIAGLREGNMADQDQGPFWVREYDMA